MKLVIAVVSDKKVLAVVRDENSDTIDKWWK